MKTTHSILNFIQNKIHIILPSITFLLAVLLICSYLIPKKVIDTYQINITEEEGDTERLIPLEDSVITYHMNTGSRPIMGIHIGVAKNGNAYDTAAIICNVYTKEGTLVSENGYLLRQGEDMQYIYIPFENYEQCFGEITMEFTYESGSDTGVTSPGILANGKELTDAYTEVDGRRVEGNMKTIYIYTHDTYPLVYDLRILTALFFAASMGVHYGKKSGNGKDKDMRTEQEGINETTVM